MVCLGARHPEALKPSSARLCTIFVYIGIVEMAIPIGKLAVAVSGHPYVV